MSKKLRLHYDYVPLVVYGFILLFVLRMSFADSVSYSINDIVRVGSLSLFAWYIVVIYSTFKQLLHGIKNKIISVGLFDEYIIRETKFGVQNKFLGACIYVILYGGVFFGLNTDTLTLKEMLLFAVLMIFIRVLLYASLYMFHNTKGSSTKDYIILYTPEEN